MCKAETRHWPWGRSLEEWAEDDLRDSEIDWIMEKENFETTLLKWEGDAESETPATGGKWFIRAGNFMNAAELLWWASDTLTALELYKMYISLPVLAYKRKHSESQSSSATKRRNAKQLKFQETGRYGLGRR